MPRRGWFGWGNQRNPCLCEGDAPHEGLLKVERREGSGFRVHGSGFRVHGSGFRVQGLGFRVQGSGFRV